MKTQTQIPCRIIRDNIECQRIAIECGIGTAFARTVDARSRHTGQPHFCSGVAMHGERVYVVQYYAGFEEAKQNGWLVLGYDNIDLYFTHLPHLLRQINDMGSNPRLIGEYGDSPASN